MNFIQAAAAGATNAVALVANIIANLIAFIALLHFVNATLTWFGQRVGIERLTFQVISAVARIFRLDGLALSVIATGTWLAGWLAGWLSHSGIVSKRLNLSENFFHHLKAPSL